MAFTREIRGSPTGKKTTHVGQEQQQRARATPDALQRGAIGALSDGQLLEQFSTSRGEPRELAFAALVERHGPFVLPRLSFRLARRGGGRRRISGDVPGPGSQSRIALCERITGPLAAPGGLSCRGARPIGDNPAPRHEHAAGALRPEAVAPHHTDDGDLEKIIHEEIDRLPGRFRVAVVLVDIEGRTHEQAARIWDARSERSKAVSPVDGKARGRLVRRGVAPTNALVAASHAGAPCATVPTGLAESTVAYAATASVVPTPIAVITEGVLRSMFLSKIKLVMTAATAVAGSRQVPLVSPSRESVDRTMRAASPSTPVQRAGHTTSRSPATASRRAR